MSTLIFDRAGESLMLFAANGTRIDGWDAANFVDHRAVGPWPDGVYNFQRHNSHPDDAPDSAFGSYGIFIFNVPGRQDMGVHSGRQNVEDGAHRIGFRHCTMGCIRTTDPAMASISSTHATDALTTITVG